MTSEFGIPLSVTTINISPISKKGSGYRAWTKREVSLELLFVLII